MLLRILSNLADRRLARARCTIPLRAAELSKVTAATTVRDGIIEAWAFAAVDPYRAATHNKGIMNGVDAVVIATGNDWRAVEAGAHAYAARTGSYTSLSTWGRDAKGNLVGALEMPMAVGIGRRVHPRASCGAARPQDHGRHIGERVGRDRSFPSGWRKTWPRCAPWPPRASSAGT